MATTNSNQLQMNLQPVFDNDTKYIKGIMLLLLAVSGNFIAETFSCSTQRVLTTNMYAKQMIVFLLIYFTINFADEEVGMNPTQHLLEAFVLWFLFLLVTKLNVVFTFIILLLVASFYIFQNYIEYHLNIVKDQRRVQQLKDIQTLLKFLTLYFIFSGIFLFLKNNYSFIRHDKSILLGVPSCTLNS